MAFVPDKGDIIIISFDPQAGHEQRGRRPGLVISHRSFNQAIGLCLVCPITNTRREHPFHVEVEGVKNVTGVIMVEQIKAMDFKARKAHFAAKAPDGITVSVLNLLDACIQ